ncbi:MAG: chemotaxis protein CheX [Thermoanaerobaculales bacterium]|nr:chemotaxis protein CheX [Thermoanaerobaculales bacterium]
MKISAKDLLEVLRIIWSAQLNMELESESPDILEDPGTMTGIVQITGGFSGALHLTCSRELIRASASRMFGLPGEDLSEDDLRDALGELTNMAGGNIKTLLPGSDDVSLPTVVEGMDYGVTRLDSLLVAQTKASYGGFPMIAYLFADRKG